MQPIMVTNFPRGPLLVTLGKKVEELFYDLGNYSYSAYDSCMGQLGSVSMRLPRYIS